MSQLRFAAAPRWVFAVLVALWTSIVAGVVVGVMRSCEPEPVPVEVITPDGGERAMQIEERLDAAVVAHDDTVRVIERTVIERRVEFDRARLADEVAVRAQGRVALADWLDTFGLTLLDAGATDYVDASEGP